MRVLKPNGEVITQRTSVTDRYLTELKKYPPLSPEEEVDLVRRFQAGDEAARNELIKRNLRFVVSVAKQYQRPALALDDLINEGNLGLFEAIERYDPTRGFKFISYAVWWIRQYLIRYCVERTGPIRVTENAQSRVTKLMRFEQAFAQEHERLPSEEEGVALLGITVEEYQELQRYKTYRRISSLDERPSDVTEMPRLLDKLADLNTLPPETFASKDDQRTTVNHLLATSNLSERERFVLEQRYGIGLQYPRRVDEIGRELGLHRVTVEKTIERALRKVRRHHKSIG